jgi:pimeloyl-ACP methyl ester carboxylesterase
MQADVLAGLLRALEMTPAVIIGGSGGARVSLLTANRHRDVARAIAVWWISGGVFGLLSLASYYCAPAVPAVWNQGLEAVTSIPSFEETFARRPTNRDLLLAQDPHEFIATMERWMEAYCSCGGELVPGLPDDEARALDIPALVFRSGASDPNHPRVTSEQVAALLPNAQLVEPPWPDTEWIDRAAGKWQGFERWPLLAPQLADWADTL